MIQFSYLCILLFIIIFSLFLMKIALNKCPGKIKVFYFISLALAFIRYSYLLFLYFAHKQSIVYRLKEIAWINYIFIPLLALASLYIYLRNQSKKFDYNYSYLILLSVLYIFLSMYYKFNISIDNIFGFLVYFRESTVPSLIYLIILALLAVISLVKMDSTYANKKGMRLLTISLMISVFEFLAFLGGIKIFVYPVLGEILILVCTYISINTFKN